MATKKRNAGYCIICGSYGLLTEDHVPPKGAVGADAVEIRSFLGQFNMKTPDKDAEPRYKKHRMRIAQNGLTFRTLCEKCNNLRLGKEYDPSLIALSQEIKRRASSYMNSGLVLPGKTDFSIKPHRVARAVVGHILASVPEKDTAKPPPEESGGMIDALQDYFLYPERPFPQEGSIYLWLYPSDLLVVLRGFGIAMGFKRVPIVGEFLKFYPVAFGIFWGDVPPDCAYAVSLFQNKEMAYDDTETISIHMRHTNHINWLETPDNPEGIRLFNSEYTFYGKKRRRK